MTQVHDGGYALVRTSDGAIVQQWDRLPKYVDHPTNGQRFYNPRPRMFRDGHALVERTVDDQVGAGDNDLIEKVKGDPVWSPERLRVETPVTEVNRTPDQVSGIVDSIAADKLAQLGLHPGRRTRLVERAAELSLQRALGSQLSEAEKTLAADIRNSLSMVRAVLEAASAIKASPSPGRLKDDPRWP